MVRLQDAFISFATKDHTAAVQKKPWPLWDKGAQLYTHISDNSSGAFLDTRNLWHASNCDFWDSITLPPPTPPPMPPPSVWTFGAVALLVTFSLALFVLGPLIFVSYRRNQLAVEAKDGARSRFSMATAAVPLLRAPRVDAVV